MLLFGVLGAFGGGSFAIAQGDFECPITLVFSNPTDQLWISTVGATFMHSGF